MSVIKTLLYTFFPNLPQDTLDRLDKAYVSTKEMIEPMYGALKTAAIRYVTSLNNFFRSGHHFS